jgi:hypothetical protein
LHARHKNGLWDKRSSKVQVFGPSEKNYFSQVPAMLLFYLENLANQQLRTVILFHLSGTR